MTHLPLLTTALAAVLLLSRAATSQDAPAEPPAPATVKEGRAQLKELQSDLAETRERQEDLREEASKIAGEIDQTTRRAIELANTIQNREDRLTRLEAQIEVLDAERSTRVRALERRQVETSRLLGALQSLSRRPPQLLLVRPGDAVTTARAAKLLTAILPQLQAQTQALRADIAAVVALRAKLDAERRTYLQEVAALKADRAELDKLLSQRERERVALLSQADDEAAKARALASQAADIRELVGRLEQEDRRRARLARLPGPRPRPDFSAPPVVAQAPARPPAARPQAPRTQTAALPPTVPLRTPGAVPGSLALPVRGEITQAFGAETGAGPARGITIRTRSDAQVVAPSAGRIMYSGTFRTYGNMIIIGHGPEYVSLLAGLSRIDARVGQTVQAGEPVGLMGAGEGDAAPVLYVELRRGGATVNPLPWLTAGGRRTQG
jgi:septal ring factor EnvC (AmiA/AmiB activator)